MSNGKGDFAKAHELSAGNEGGISKDTKDTGNYLEIKGNKELSKVFVATRYGQTFGNWLSANGKSTPKNKTEFDKLAKEFGKVDEEGVKASFKKQYWTKYNLDDIADADVASNIYDAMINQTYTLGGGGEQKTLANVLTELGYDVDKDTSFTTNKIAITAINKAIEEKGAEAVNTAYSNQREQSYIGSGTVDEHGKGWLKRLNLYREEEDQYSKEDLNAMVFTNDSTSNNAVLTSIRTDNSAQVAGVSQSFNEKLTKEDKKAYLETYGGKMFLGTTEKGRLANIKKGGYENQGVFEDDDQGMIIGYGIDLNKVNTVELLVENGVNRSTAEKWKELGILGKTKSELESEGKSLGGLKLKVYISNTDSAKSDMAMKQSMAIDKKLEKYQGKVSDDVYMALANNLQINGDASEGGFDSESDANESHASSLVYAAIDKWIAENPNKPVPDKLVHKIFKSNSDSLADSGNERAADAYFDNAESLLESSLTANNYHLDIENVVSDYDYSAKGDAAKIEALLRREANGEELTNEESDYLYNAQLNNHEVFYEATEASKRTKGIMTEQDIALLKKSKEDPSSLTEDEKAALEVINKEEAELRNNLNIEATDDALVRVDETGGLGPAVIAADNTAERTEVETGLVSGDSTEQDKAMRIAKGEADHKARIQKMLKEFDSYNEDGTLITEEQVKARQAAEDKLNQDKLDAANSEKKEGQMRKAEMALTGLKAAAGILSLSQALQAPDVETPELDPLIYEALSKQKALSESGLTAKEKGAAMQNMNDAYAGAMKNVLRASGGQRGMYLANQGTVDAQRIQGLNQLAAKDAALHRQNIKEYNALATSVGSMKLNRDMNVEQMRQATLNNNRQILSGVGSNLLSDAISDVSYYMNPNRKATEDLIKNLSGKNNNNSGYENPLLNQEITTANITPEEQAVIDKEAAANAKNTTD
tara:strand:- start:2207 stop:5023 length:2817 start_codon:yes stop_codon:yes gene_type:complete